MEITQTQFTNQQKCEIEDLLGKLTAANRTLYQVCLPIEDAAQVIVELSVIHSDFLAIPTSLENAWIISDDPALSSMTTWAVRETTALGVRVILGNRTGELGFSDRWREGQLGDYGSRFPRLWPGSLEE